MHQQHKTMFSFGIFWTVDQFYILQGVRQLERTASELLDEDPQQTGCTHPAAT